MVGLRAGLLGLVFLLSGCAELPGLFQQTALTDATVLGPAADSFRATGRFTLTSGERRDHVRFEWEHGTDRDQVLLMSPLGQGVAQLTRDQQGVRLVRRGQDDVSAVTLRQLSQRLFGNELPLDQLADWLRGAQGALYGRSEGWRIVVRDVLLQPDRTLPRIMEIANEEVELRLVVDTWEMLDANSR